MKKITTYSTALFTSMFLMTACTQHPAVPVTENTTAEHHASAHHTKHWGYAADVGPSHWSTLNDKFKMCSEGKEQSPINVVPSSDINLAKLALNYAQGSKSVINNGHTVQVNIQSGDTLTINGTAYELKQFHFHTPSENHISGESFPLEAHFVHASADGKLAVIAVMFKEGSENPTLNKIIKTFPLEKNQEATLAFSKEYLDVVMPNSREYYHFIGSLTTPPCSEKVNWFVLKTTQTASAEQIAAMHKEIGMNNNRPIQGTNGRSIEK